MRRFLALIVALLSLSCALHPPPGCYESKGFTYEAVYLPGWAHDGDTFWAAINGWSYRVRPAGVNCPETEDAGGPEAAEFTRSLLVSSSRLTLEVVKPWGKYGRLICRVYLDTGELSPLLLDAGHAVPYKD